MKQDDKDEVQEIPEDRPKKVPRILPVSREEYDSPRQHIDDDDKIEYVPSTFNVNLEDEKKQQEEKKSNAKPPSPLKQKPNQDKPVTIFDFVTMIPVVLTALSLLWHLTWQEVHPLIHSIIDFVLILYHSIWILAFLVKDKMDDSEMMLMVTATILEIVMLGNYGDMSHIYLQCMFSVPLMLVLLIIFIVLEENADKRGKFAIAFGKCVWFGVIVFALWRRVQNFRWIGFCQLIGIFFTTLSPALSNKKVTTKDKCFIILSVMAILRVIFGFGR